MSKKYCKGWDEHILVTEIEGKVWHDYDIYCVKCSKCGAKEDRKLARRPSQVIIACKGVD